jgi:hypothetical protein
VHAWHPSIGEIAAFTIIASGVATPLPARTTFATIPAGLVDYWLEIAAVAVDVGHLTQRMHIFHESHVPSQQT